MKKFSAAIFLAISLFGVVGVVFANSLTMGQNTVKNKTEQVEDECSLEAEGKASYITNQETGKAPENCMDEMKE
ncbi:hypothetical protein P5G62_011170 [Neobacillus sp. 179-C4.2 HS]|uniref:Uncharacterized protein n=1 Tax=Neobacillus driksii TaxID=3035913 RepID=A0ABV4YS34_9BACI|nr:hypothetical protein [Neobacillus sp. 179.-C4.2 HS]MDP5194214.1 hypothetical protein [Neobacillus sp. 179.-C4.2 HS]